ncbi:Protein of unknown function [Gryllus bimaculatus]|nr:Protein of unknown function [Gryllus bimaculatus]
MSGEWRVEITIGSQYHLPEIAPNAMHLNIKLGDTLKISSAMLKILTSRFILRKVLKACWSLPRLGESHELA